MEENILNYSREELNEYIKTQTKGMQVSEKLDFGWELLKRIDDLKQSHNRN